MDVDRFSKIATSIQSIVTIIGLIVGGAWVLFTFWDLKSYQKASAEIAELEQRARFDAWASKQAMVSAELKLHILGSAEGGKVLVSFEGVVRNNAKRSFRIASSNVQVAKMSPDNSASVSEIKIVAQQLKDDGLDQMSERNFPSNQARTFVYLPPPLSPGVYFVQLNIMYFDLDLQANGTLTKADGPFGVAEQMVINLPNQSQ